MALDKFFKKAKEPDKQEVQEETNITKKIEVEQAFAQKDREVLTEVIENKEPIAPDISFEGIILDVGYDGTQAKAYILLYNKATKQLQKWYDTTGHLPYLLSDLSETEIKTQYSGVMTHNGFAEMKSIKKFDLLRDKPIAMTKVIAKDPLSIGGRQNSIRNLLENHSWEDYIRYHKCYAYDNQIVIGMPYQVTNGRLNPIHPEISEVIKSQISHLFEGEKEEYLLTLEQYLEYFFSPIPDIRRVAFDIEVFSPPNKIPDAEKAEERITCISFAGTDGLKKVLVLKREDVELGAQIPDFDGEFKIIANERELLLETFRILEGYPIIISFNGDNFDLKYIYNRAVKHLGFQKDQIPLYMTISPQSEVGHFKNSIHLDLYKFFHNRAIMVSAFRNIYKDVSLDTVAQTFLDSSKIILEKPISELTLNELAYYCLRDSEITLKLTTFNENLIMDLMILLMRITRLSLEDMTRQGVSTWLQNLFYAEHRARAFLIPNPDYIRKVKGQASTTAMIKGKKYKGAIVVKPQPGIHFNVVVLDFASLYPSIIKTWNLSYETVNCNHAECQKNRIPETPHWVCTKKVGIMALIIGLLRDLRVKYFKNMAKDKTISNAEKNMYNIITQSLKIIINASYGVFGSEAFPLFCLPVAEATTAIGRYAITQTQKKCEEIGVEVIYGDTDSVFLKSPTQEQIQELIDWSENELQIELDIDKVYRYLALSERKKNYLGVYKDGNVDIKGLTGKKRHMPPFIQNAFYEMVDELKKVNALEDFEDAKRQIRNKLKGCIKKLEKNLYSVDELAFQMTLSKDLDKYVKSIPQHVRAAQLLETKLHKKVDSGDIIQFVKTKGGDGVLPIELAKPSDVSIKKYKQQLESTFEQVLDAIGIPIEELYGVKTRKLDAFI